LTDIDRFKLQEEIDALTKFCYINHFEDWIKFCDTERKDKGNQSIEQLSMMVRSLTAEEGPWRFLLDINQLDGIEGFLDIMTTLTKKVRKRLALPDDYTAIVVDNHIEWVKAESSADKERAQEA